MIHTSTSLLVRLQSGAEAEAWSRFVSLYTPLLFYWVRRQGVPAADAADLVQDVFTVLVTKLPAFHYDRQRRFSDWLRTVTANKCRDYFRRRTVRCEQTGSSAEAEVIDHVTGTVGGRISGGTGSSSAGDHAGGVRSEHLASLLGNRGFRQACRGSGSAIRGQRQRRVRRQKSRAAASARGARRPVGMTLVAGLALQTVGNG